MPRIFPRPTSGSIKKSEANIYRYNLPRGGRDLASRIVRDDAQRHRRWRMGASLPRTRL